MKSRIAATFSMCLLATAAAAAALAEATEGLEHWTFEERRRALAARGQLSAPLLANLGTPANEIRIVDFIYTRCPTVCRVLGSEYQRMQASIIE